MKKKGKTMVEIREMFHKIGNYHNKISVGAGLAKFELDEIKNGDNSLGLDKIIKMLSDMEKTTVEASKELRQLKDIIYAELQKYSSETKK